MTDQQISQEPEAPIESEKQACDLEFFSRANVFAQKAIADIPELHAIAIVPLWSPQLENVPNGLIRLRDETPPYLAALLQMMSKLAAFGVDVHRDMFTQMKAFDKMAGNLMAEIKRRTEQIDQLESKAQDSR